MDSRLLLVVRAGLQLHVTAVSGSGIHDTSLEPRPSSPRFYLAALEKNRAKAAR